MKGLDNVPKNVSTNTGVSANSTGFDYMKAINKFMPKSGGGYEYRSRSRSQSRSRGRSRGRSRSRSLAGGRRKKTRKK